MIIKKYKKIGLIGFFVGLFVFFSFFDLQFSNLVVNQKSLYAHFFYMFGELPGTFMGLVSLAILTVSYKQEGKKYATIGLFIATNCMSLILCYQMIQYLGLNRFPTILIGFILSFIVIHGADKLSIEKKKYLRKYAIVGFLTMALGILIPNLIKIIWARPRYRILIGSDIAYQAWFNPQGMTFEDDWKSFPSGHSAAAAVSLVYIYLPQIFDRLKGKEPVILSIIVLWIINVMISRVIRGDHFVTDTLVGTGLSCIIFIQLHKLLIENTKKKIKNSRL